jgi:acyl carrier protein
MEEGDRTDAIEQELLAFIKQTFNVQPEMDEPLALVGIDSVGMAEMTLELEKRYNIRVDETIFDVDTVADLVSYVRERQATEG